MIPGPDALIDPVTGMRWTLTKLAATLTREGVDEATLLADVRQGINLAHRPARPHAHGGTVPPGLYLVAESTEDGGAPDA